MYKCKECQKTYNDSVLDFSICYVCEYIFCDKCFHAHCITVYVDETLKQLIKDKGKYAKESFLKPFNCDSLGYPINFDYTTIDLAQVEATRTMIKPYRIIDSTGIFDYKYFAHDIIKMKIKFLYQLYRLLLKKKFCYDITEHVLSFI